MRLTITKEAPWTIGGKTRTFKEGQQVEAGVDVPDNIAEQMLEHGYAKPAVTKVTLVQETKAVETVADATPEVEADDESDAPARKPRGRRRAADKE